VLVGARLDLVEALGVGDQFGGVQGASDILDEVVLRDTEGLQRGELTGGEVAGGGGALVARTGQCPGEDGFADACGGDAQVEGPP
jgi:hypothetical protein